MKSNPQALRLFDPVQKSATVSECGAYRYDLNRVWEPERVGGCVLFVMLNPSTADHEKDDPTLRRCLSFARSWGFGSLSVVNLFSLRATDPRELFKHPDPVGPETDEAIDLHAEAAELVVAAWGVFGRFMGRDAAVRRILAPHRDKVVCLGTTAGGMPKHPLRLAGSTARRPYPLEG
jgi:hypothetical protein